MIWTGFSSGSNQARFQAVVVNIYDINIFLFSGKDMRIHLRRKKHVSARTSLEFGFEFIGRIMGVHVHRRGLTLKETGDDSGGDGGRRTEVRTVHIV